VGELSAQRFAEMLAINAVGIVLLAYVLYFRRHRRRELLVGYVAVNISLFVVAASLGSTSPLNVGVGFGLFAVLSIIRLRSDEASYIEIGYMMAALALGLLSGLPGLDREYQVAFAVLIVVAVYLVDHPALVPPDRHLRYRLWLEVVETDPARLHALLEERLGAVVREVVVLDVDYVRETMRVDVRLTIPRGTATS
jgi:hypothetical protein